jgi:hypothetical protein
MARTPTARRRPPADHRPVTKSRAGTEVRHEQRELFALVLRGEPNRRGKPYSERTIGAYLDAVDSLAQWLTDAQHPTGFDTLTTRQLDSKA